MKMGSAMADKLVLPLSRMDAGMRGTVAEIRGGHGLVRRLDALGIRPGKQVSKVSSMLFRGPVVVRVDNSQVAIGFGMASRVIVEVDATS